MSPPNVSASEFTSAEREVARHRPADLKAPNHNDVRAFVHAWFAAFDHAGPVEFFLGHLDDADMTFNMDVEALAHDHASFARGTRMRSRTFRGTSTTSATSPSPASARRDGRRSSSFRTSASGSTSRAEVPGGRSAGCCAPPGGSSMSVVASSSGATSCRPPTPPWRSDRGRPPPDDQAAPLANPGDAP